ncbi:MAG: hypothetical protein ACRDRG_12330 [Pseudonocardiaceae bacterium]
MWPTFPIKPADATLIQLDLADLSSVHKAADEVGAITGNRLDVDERTARLLWEHRAAHRRGSGSRVG